MPFIGSRRLETPVVPRFLGVPRRHGFVSSFPQRMKGSTDKFLVFISWHFSSIGEVFKQILFVVGDFSQE
jgi:hypothetical protein